MRLIDVYNGMAYGRPARPGAVEFLYGLLKERPAEANISHRTLPSLEEHRAFVEGRPYRFWYLIDIAPELVQAQEQCWVGSVSATVHNEIGIFVAQAHQRRGYARTAIELFRLRHGPLPGIPSERNPRWLANVATGNEPSLALFEKLGRQIQITYEL